MSATMAPDAVRRPQAAHRATARLGVATALVDVCVLVAGLLLARTAWAALHLVAPAPGSVSELPLAVLVPLVVGGWVLAIVLAGGYRPEVFGAGLDEYKATTRASLATAAAVGIVCYAAKIDLARGFFLLAFALGAALLVLGRHLFRRALHNVRARGALRQRVLIVGTEGHVDEIASVLWRERWLGYDVVGAVLPERPDRESTHLGVPLVGVTSAIAETATEQDADVVFLAGGALDSADQMRRLVWDLEHKSTQVVIAPSVTDVSAERVSVRPVGGLPLIHLERPRATWLRSVGKRAFDVVGASVALTLLAPLALVVALLIRQQGRGPVLLRREAQGRAGQTFTLRSFRTTSLQAADGPVEPRMGDYIGSLADDDEPHLLRGGAWMRRHCVDELPHLLSVLTGDMSLVGPRAMQEHELVDDATAARWQVRPGFTGVWRDFRRSDMSWYDAVRLDVYFVDNWSASQDLTLLVRTFVAACRGTAAR